MIYIFVILQLDKSPNELLFCTSLRGVNNVSDVVIQKKSFYVYRTVDLWVATLTSLQTVQSFATTVTYQSAT